MDPLRLMLLSMLVGATVSTGPTDMSDGIVGTQPAAIVQQVEQAQQVQQPAAQASKVPIIYINVTAAPATQTQSAAASFSSGSANTTTASSAKTQTKTISTGTSITRELYRGTEGDDVRMLQKLLSNLHYSVNVDGYFGTQTRNAVIAFQRNNGLKADGIAGTRTIRKLASSSAVPAGGSSTPRATLSYGMRGQDVADLQQRLSQLGYYYDIVSGNFLTNTRYAVRWFQQMNALNPDGIAGPMTLSRVYSQYAIPAGEIPVDPSIPSGYTRTLAYGMTGSDVTALQTRLRDLGYYYDVISGKFLTNTRSAVRWFQTLNGLTVDGIAGTATIARMYSPNVVTPGITPGPVNVFTRTLQKGMTGTDVTYLQTLLGNLGYFNISTSNYFGNETENAVRTFQWYNNLYIDGIAGAATQNLLLSNRAVPFPVGGSTNAGTGSTGTGSTGTGSTGTGSTGTGTGATGTGSIGSTGTDTGNTGTGSTGTDGGNTGTGNTGTDSGNTGTGNTGADGGNTGTGSTGTDGGNTGTGSTGTDGGNTGTGSTGTDGGNTGTGTDTSGTGTENTNTTGGGTDNTPPADNTGGGTDNTQSGSEGT